MGFNMKKKEELYFNGENHIDLDVSPAKKTDWKAMQAKSAKNDPRYGKMSAEEYKAEALRQAKSKKETGDWDAMGKYDYKGAKLSKTKTEAPTEETTEEPTTEKKKVGQGNIDVSGYEKDNIYDLQAEKYKEKDERLEKRQDKRNERMKKTDEYIEKNKAVKGETGKNIGRFFKRVGGKLKKSVQRAATNRNRKRQVKQETKINELEEQKKKAENAKLNAGKESTLNKTEKGKGENKTSTDSKKVKETKDGINKANQINAAADMLTIGS